MAAFRTPPPGPIDMSPDKIQESWKLFKQKWGYYKEITGLVKKTDAEQRPHFLNCIGDEALKVYNTFTWVQNNEGADPLQIENIPNIQRKLEAYIKGEINETVERYIFNQRKQKEGESLDTFLTDLKTLATTCNFCNCLKDSLLRDKLVSGIKCDLTRKKLLEKRDLTLNLAIDICRSAESSTKHMDMYKGNSTDVNKIRKSFDKKSPSPRKPLHTRTSSKPSYPPSKSSPASKPEKKKCKFCGFEHEMLKSKCPAYGETCRNCNRKNHFKKMCLKSISHVSSFNDYDDDDVSSDGEPVYYHTGSIGVSAVKSKPSDNLVFAEMHVHDCPVRFQIDCGATPNIIPIQYLNKHDKVSTDKVPTLKMWNGAEMTPIGTSHVNI